MFPLFEMKVNMKFDHLKVVL